MNSPRTFGSGRPADAWATPMAPVDLDQFARLQRSQSQVSRLATQSPYLDPTTFNQINQNHIPDLQAHAHLMQQLYQYQGYPIPGQQFYPPTAPAAYGGRPGRNQNPYENYKATPQLLEEFKKTSKGANRKWQLRDIFGYVTDFAGDQQGSRFLQEKIPTANSEDKQRVFDEILVNANQMMTDVFGNYIVQKLFEFGTLVQKKLLASKMQGNVVDLSMNIYGCCILVDQQIELVKELEPDIIRLMQGIHSNHVIQRVIQKLPRQHIDFVYDAVRGKVFTLSTQQYACRVIQRMVETGAQADKAFILDEFRLVAPKLVTDDWGNYVVQAVLKNGGDEARREVIRLCIDQFLAFSKQKVASNVMEHCIQFGTMEERLEIYHLIMNTRTEDGSGLLQTMWKDQFANYVVQKLCFHLKGVEQETLIRESRSYYLARKKPSRPDEKWAAFENLMSQFRATISRQGSIGSANGDLNGVTASRPSSQSDMNSAMPTPALTTGGNSPRTSSSQATNDGTAEADTAKPLRDLLNKFDEASIHDKVQA
ncbi:mRNA binding protein puf3 [Diaporthe australafricana]|uniref:mRNA binding protein puf3 n=1 Tax=Diaporthe australafricana TaxID=127596 RepID=A0ABR3XNY9_9PEZI